MVKIRVISVILTYILSAAATFGADRLQLVSLKDDMLPEPQVTAEAVFVGLVRPKANSVTGTNSETILAALPPENRANGVCVRVTTADGLYSGVAEYKSSGAGSSNMTLMDYVSEEEALSAYSENEIAVLVFPCDGAMILSTAAVATWRGEDVLELGETVNLLVNSFRADAAFLIVNDSEQVDCLPYKVGERAAFDFSCQLDAKQIETGARLSLFRIRGASIDPELSLSVVGWE